MMNTEDSSKTQDAIVGEARGLLALLLDFSFTTFITQKIIKWLYIASIIMAGLGVLGWIGAAWSTHSILYWVLPSLAPLNVL